MKPKRRHYYRNGKLTGYCSRRQFGELKATAERMKQARKGQSSVGPSSGIKRQPTIAEREPAAPASSAVCEK